MQPTEQTLRTAGPLSGFAQRTWSGAVAGTSAMSRRGHAATHFPQPMQRFFSTRARPSSMRIAFFGQTRAQLP